jgi:phosphotransacetylase
VSFLDGVRRRAAATPMRIVFPESWDARTLEAVRVLHRDRIALPLLVLDPARSDSHAQARDTGITVIDPSADARAAAVAAHLLVRRRAKGLEPSRAEQLSTEPLYFADGSPWVRRTPASPERRRPRPTCFVPRSGRWARLPA